MNPEDPDAIEDISEYLPTREEFASALECKGDAEAEKNARENIRLQDALAELSEGLLPGEDPLFHFDPRTREAMKKKRALRMGKILEFPQQAADIARSRKMSAEEKGTAENESGGPASTHSAPEKSAAAPHFPTEMLDLEAIRAAVKASVNERPEEPAVVSQAVNEIREEPAAVSQAVNDPPKLTPLAEMRSGFAEAAAASIVVATPEPRVTERLTMAEPVATSWQQAGARQVITQRMTNVQPSTREKIAEQVAVTEETPPLVRPGVRPGEPGKQRGVVANALLAIVGILLVAIMVWAWRLAPGSAAQHTPEPIPATSAPSSAATVVAASMPSAAANPRTTAAPANLASPSPAVPETASPGHIKVIPPKTASNPSISPASAPSVTPTALPTAAPAMPPAVVAPSPPMQSAAPSLPPPVIAPDDFVLRKKGH